MIDRCVYGVYDVSSCDGEVTERERERDEELWPFGPSVPTKAIWFVCELGLNRSLNRLV